MLNLLLKDKTTDRALKMSCLVSDLKDMNRSLEAKNLESTYSDTSTPARRTIGLASSKRFNQDSIQNFIDIQNNSMDTKRLNSYTKQKKWGRWSRSQELTTQLSYYTFMHLLITKDYFIRFGKPLQQLLECSIILATCVCQNLMQYIVSELKSPKFISRNSTLKISKTTKVDTLVNSVEKKLVQRLKETERSMFDENILEQRFSIIEECMKYSICKLTLILYLGEIYPWLKSTMGILLGEIRGLFEKQYIKFESEVKQEKQLSQTFHKDLLETQSNLEVSKQDFEKMQKRLQSEINSLKQNHQKEVEKLDKELGKKNSDIMGQLKKYIIQDIDLDEYNITSDDFRPTMINEQKSSEKKPVQQKCHPLVPKLDLNRIILDEDDTSNDVTPHYDAECGIED